MIEQASRFASFLKALPDALAPHWRDADASAEGAVALALFEGEGEALRDFSVRLSQREGPIVTVFALSSRRIEQGEDYPLEFLLRERSLSVNTAAAGGNASLMSIAPESEAC